MNNIIQFPRSNPWHKWSPAEILVLKEEPDDRTRQRQERSRIATTQKIAAEAGKRENKRARRKQEIAKILANGKQWTIAHLMRLVERQTNEPISRTTVAALLKELEAEGRATNSNKFWFTTTQT
jgi:hypothetical protein